MKEVKKLTSTFNDYYTTIANLSYAISFTFIPFTPQIRQWIVLERQHFNTTAQSKMSAFDQKYQLLQLTTKNPTQPMVGHPVM